MKSNIRMLQKQRKYSEEFKRKIVADFEKGQLSVPQLGRLHGIDYSVIYGWIHKYSNFNESGSRVVEMRDSSVKKVKDLEKKVKELERIVGQKQIMIDYLERMIEISKEELKIDIKKKFDTPQSSGSESTDPN